MTSQKSSVSTSYSGSGQKWAQPYAKQGVANVFSAYGNAQPTLDKAVAGTGGLSEQLSGQYSAGQENAGLARGYLSDVLSGKYLNSNPYLEQNIANARGGVMDAVNGNYNLAGRYGSASHGAGVARELGNLESSMRMGDYNAQMGRMDQAANMAGQQNSANAAQALGGYGQLGQLPYAGMNSLASSLGALFNGGNSKSVQYSPNPIWGALGAGLGAAGAYFGGGGTLSSGKAKNIEGIDHVDPDGLEWVWFHYKNDPSKTRLKGVIAEQVKQLRPWAYIENFVRGMPGVDYGKLNDFPKAA